MEENKEILLNSKKNAKAIDTDLDFKMTLDSSQNLMRLGDRDIVLNIDQLYNTERNGSINYKSNGKLGMIFVIYIKATEHIHIYKNYYIYKVTEVMEILQVICLMMSLPF